MTSDAAAEAYLRARRLTGEAATASGTVSYLRPEITHAVDQEVAAWLQVSAVGPRTTSFHLYRNK